MPPALFPTTPIVLDGALATELEARGLSLTTRLWSAAALASPDSAAAIRAVHASYYASGSTIATTASYQASLPGLRAAGYGDEEARALVKKSVDVAKQARDEEEKKKNGASLLVAGSVGPYGAFLADGSEYTGRYALSVTAFKDFHRERIAVLLENGVDLLALETMPNRVEIEALVELLRDEFPNSRAWLGVTVRRRREAVKGGSHLTWARPIWKRMPCRWP